VILLSQFEVFRGHEECPNKKTADNISGFDASFKRCYPRAVKNQFLFDYTAKAAVFNPLGRIAIFFVDTLPVLRYP